MAIITILINTLRISKVNSKTLTSILISALVSIRCSSSLKGGFYIDGTNNDYSKTPVIYAFDSFRISYIAFINNFVCQNY